MADQINQRRALLGFFLGSPLMLVTPELLAQTKALQTKLASAPQSVTNAEVSTLIASAQDAINVFDFEPVAQQKLSEGHWAFLSTGVDDEVTLRANRTGFQKFNLRERRLRDTSNLSLETQLLGASLASPILIAPAGGLKALHAEGELAVARAAGARRQLMVLSTTATTSIESAMAASGAPVWYQLYPTDNWNVTVVLLKRVERAGCRTVVLTVDMPGNRESVTRFRRDTNPVCMACHQPGFANMTRRLPMFDDIDTTGTRTVGNPNMTWEFVKRVQDATGMQVVLKGITTGEDAQLAVEHGIKGLHVSNHGGRAGESGRSTIEALPEIARAVNGRMPIIIDSGFRRGTDILKALALGASAVGIGRPYLWGLAAFGQDGVDQVLKLLNAELTMAMQQCGLNGIKSITRDVVIPV